MIIFANLNPPSVRFGVLLQATLVDTEKLWRVYLLTAVWLKSTETCFWGVYTKPLQPVCPPLFCDCTHHLNKGALVLLMTIGTKG